MTRCALVQAHQRTTLAVALALRTSALKAPGRGSARREDKDSLTVGPRTAVRRLGCRREDKDSPGFLIFPHSTTPPRRLPRLRRPRRAMSSFSRPSIRRLNAQPDGRGWSCGSDHRYAHIVDQPVELVDERTPSSASTMSASSIARFAAMFHLSTQRVTQGSVWSKAPARRPACRSAPRARPPL